MVVVIAAMIIFLGVVVGLRKWLNLERDSKVE
jgi:hypothetical protein